jgi:DNA-binding transcriptional ArsR family regulator
MRLRRPPEPSPAIDGPAAVFLALSTPARWLILDELARHGECSPADLHDALHEVGRTSLSYHLRVLHHAELITERKAGRNRFYALRSQTLAETVDVLRGLTARPYPAPGGDSGSGTVVSSPSCVR